MKQIFILFFLVSIYANGQRVIWNNITFGYTKSTDGMCCLGVVDDAIEQDSIVFPDSIVVNGEAKPINRIWDNAFVAKKKLRYVRFPKGLQHIGWNNFCECPNLEEIVFPPSIKIIPSRTMSFDETPNLTFISVDPQNTKYDSRENANALILTAKNEILLGTSNTKIPSSIVSLGYKAFLGNKRLKSIHIPSNVIHIRNRCFEGCDSLNNVTFDDKENSNATYALEIGISAFADCKNIKSMILPERLDSIGRCAFHGCEKLESITIPANVKNIDGSILGKCTQLSSISVDKNNKKYDSRNNCNAIIETKTNTLISACKNTRIPKSIKKIGHSAFSYVDIDSVYIENGLKSIGEFAFANSKIRVVVIPKTVKVIEYGIFECCDNLQKIYLKHLTPPKFDDITNYEERLVEDCPNLTIYVTKKAYPNFKADRVWQMFNIEAIDM